jgi:hypothetical protein
MTPTAFLRAVLTLWGGNSQQPCLQLRAEHGHHPTRQTLWNRKTGNNSVPVCVEKRLLDEEKARQAIENRRLAARFVHYLSHAANCGARRINSSG